MIDPSGHPIEANGLAHLSEAEVAGYLDHDLSAGERRRVETHIEQCAKCRAELIALSRITRAEPSTKKLSQRPFRWWIASAAAVVVAALLLPRLTSSPPAPDARQPVRRVSETDGRARLAIVSPGDDMTVVSPVVFTWHSTNADVYRIVVVTESGDPVWKTDTGDTTIALPDSVTLQPGRAYFWHVDGISNGIAAVSGQHRLQIRGQ